MHLKICTIKMKVSYSSKHQYVHLKTQSISPNASKSYHNFMAVQLWQKQFSSIDPRANYIGQIKSALVTFEDQRVACVNYLFESHHEGRSANLVLKVDVADVRLEHDLQDGDRVWAPASDSM